MYIVGRAFSKVMDCYEALDYSCKNASDAMLEIVKRTVNYMCTEKNMNGNNVGDDLEKAITRSAFVW